MARLHPGIQWLALSLIATFGCSEPERPDSLSIPLTAGGSRSYYQQGGAEESYPAGPYGSNDPDIGEVVPNLKLLGYFNQASEKVSSELSYGEFAIEDLRRTGARYLLIHPSAVWCASCYVEARQLNRELSSILGSHGAVLQLLVDGAAPGADPTKAELDAWVKESGLRMSVGMATDDHLRDVFSGRGYVFLVNLETMQVVHQVQGIQLNPSIMELAIPELMENWLNAPR